MTDSENQLRQIHKMCFKGAVHLRRDPNVNLHNRWSISIAGNSLWGKTAQSVIYQAYRALQMRTRPRPNMER